MYNNSELQITESNYTDEAEKIDELYLTLGSKSIRVLICPCDNLESPTYDYLSDAMGTQDDCHGIDIETYKHVDYEVPYIHPDTHSIRLVQIYSGKQVYVLDRPDVNTLKKYFKSRVGYTFVAHSAAFERKFLDYADIKCTISLFNFAKHKEGWTSGAGLADVCKLLFGLEIDKKLQKSDWSKESLSIEQYKYAALDAVLTRAVYLKLDKYRYQSKVWNINIAATPCIYDMQTRGIRIDTIKHSKLIAEWNTTASRTRKIIETTLAGINLNSTKQLAAKLLELGFITDKWPKTDKGALKTDMKTLEENLPNKELREAFTCYKTYNKLITTYGESLAKHIHEDGKIHPEFTQLKTATGRTSCTEPNMQNIPRGSGLRSIVIASPGNTLVCADYNQIELRIAAILSKDEVMLDAYRTGKDLHTLTAQAISGKRDVSKEDRQAAKAVNFALLFGAGAHKLVVYARQNYGVELTTQEAKKHIDAFRKLYPQFRRWQLRRISSSEQNMKATTVLGNTRILSAKSVYTESLNHPVQGTAAEVGSRAFIDIKKYELPLINFVHDEFLLDSPSNLVDNHKEMLSKAMTDAYVEILGEDAPTFNLIGCNTGANWEEAK